jgi:hypothetical protein
MKTFKKCVFLFFISSFLFACASPNFFDTIKVLKYIEEKHCEEAKTYLRGSFTVAAFGSDKYSYSEQWEDAAILLDGVNKEGITYQLVFMMKDDEPICVAAFKGGKPDKQLFNSFSACAVPNTSDTLKVVKYVEKRCEETKTRLRRENFVVSVCGSDVAIKYPYLGQWENAAILWDGVNKEGIAYQLVFMMKDNEPICVAAFKGGKPDKQLFNFYR